MNPNSTQRRDLHTITGWLTDLADLTAGSVPLPDAKTRAATFATILIDQYPPAAFTRASLLHVASHCKFFPSYAELTEHLTAHWRDNRPNHLRLNAPDTLPPQRNAPTTDELETVASIVKRGVADMQDAYDAVYAPRGTKAAERPTARYLTRTQLNAEYAKLGIKGPQVPS